MQEENEVDIITVGCEDHLQLRNKLKGTAMQKIILETINNKYEDLSIKQILDIVSKRIKDYFYVQSPFMLNDKIYNLKHEIVSIEEFSEILKVKVKERIIDKKWKVCSYCGQFILAEKQKTKKCRKCKKGFFSFKKRIYENWEGIFSGNKKGAISFLCNEGYLKMVGEIKKRVDFFHFASGVFYIYESKNKEETGLTFADLVRSLIYPKIIRDSNYEVKELKLIFNGTFTEELEEQVKRGFAEKFDFKVGFYPIKKYLEEEGIKIKEVFIDRTEKKYSYEIKYGDSDQIKIIISKNIQGGLKK